jgi:hypothetical protein
VLVRLLSIVQPFLDLTFVPARSRLQLVLCLPVVAVLVIATSQSVDARTAVGVVLLGVSVYAFIW